MGCRGATARDPDGLWHGEGAFEGGVVDGGDAVDAEADAEDDEGGLEVVGGGFLGGGCEEGVDVDVAVVGAGVDAEGGVGVFVCERSSPFVSTLTSVERGRTTLTSGIVQQRLGRTILRDAFRTPALRARRSGGC